MSEQELKNFIVVYQQKMNELIAQNVALEARLIGSNQIIETLKKKITELESQETSKRPSKKNEDFT